MLVNLKVAIIRDSGYAFNCAETVWLQWLRLPYVNHDP
jgi:hypothetical protein